ncbi:hypothetical protein ACU686_26225 [Yinghuangia aomiensis]
MPAAPTMRRGRRAGAALVLLLCGLPGRPARRRPRRSRVTKSHRALHLVAAYRGAAWLAAGPVTAAAVAASLHPRSGAALRSTAAAKLVLGTVVPAALTARSAAPARPCWRSGGEQGNCSPPTCCAAPVRGWRSPTPCAAAIRSRPTFAPKAHDRGAAA